MDVTCGVLTDTHTVAAIRALLAAEKPESCTPLELLHVVHLLVAKEDHPNHASQVTLSNRLCADVRTIQRCQNTLEKRGWIAKRERRGRSNAMTLLYENLPTAEFHRTIISDAARNLAGQYQGILRQRRIRQRFPKGWLGQQHLSAQKVINECGGDSELAFKVIDHALRHPKHRKRAAESLYNLRTRWKQVKESFCAEHPGAFTTVTATVPARVHDAPTTNALPASAPAPAPAPVKPTALVCPDSIASDVANLLGMPGKACAWMVVVSHLEDKKHTREHIARVAAFAYAKFGKETMTKEGPTGFERHFALIESMMFNTTAKKGEPHE
jgi:hypothetical protein